MNTRKSDERKPPLYYATLSLMLVAFTFTAAHSTTVCDHQVCQEPMLATSR